LTQELLKHEETAKLYRDHFEKVEKIVHAPTFASTVDSHPWINHENSDDWCMWPYEPQAGAKWTLSSNSFAKSPYELFVEFKSTLSNKYGVQLTEEDIRDLYSIYDSCSAVHLCSHEPNPAREAYISMLGEIVASDRIYGDTIRGMPESIVNQAVEMASRDTILLQNSNAWGRNLARAIEKVTENPDSYARPNDRFELVDSAIALYFREKVYAGRWNKIKDKFNEAYVPLREKISENIADYIEGVQSLQAQTYKSFFKRFEKKLGELDGDVLRSESLKFAKYAYMVTVWGQAMDTVMEELEAENSNQQYQLLDLKLKDNWMKLKNEDAEKTSKATENSKGLYERIVSTLSYFNPFAKK
jgi:hypothetical protein